MEWIEQDLQEIARIAPNTTTIQLLSANPLAMTYDKLAPILEMINRYLPKMEYIYAATAAKYGDPLGPDYESLRRRKSCAEVIEAAARPIKNLDERITIEGFREWYRRREKD